MWSLTRVLAEIRAHNIMAQKDRCSIQEQETGREGTGKARQVGRDSPLSCGTGPSTGRVK